MRLRSGSRTIAGGAIAALLMVVARRRRARRLAHAAAGIGPGVLTDDGVMLHVETDGPEEAPLTVVFAHGFCARMEEYAYQRSALRGDHRLVLFDQRGHGRSGWGGYRAATLQQLGRDLGRVVDQCTGDGPVALVGHSLGGMGLMALAGSRPELFGHKVVAVALISTSAGRPSPGVPGRIADALAATGVLRAFLWGIWFVAPITGRLTPFRTGVGRRLLRRRLFGLDPPPDHMLVEVQQMWIGTSRMMASAFYPGMLAHDTTHTLPVLAAIPSLVLTGAADATIPAAHSDRIAAAIGERARLVRVPRAGHMVNMTHAGSVNDALRRLFGQVVLDTGSARISNDR